MSELITLPADGVELELFENFEGLSLPEPESPKFISLGTLDGFDQVNIYDFNWSSKYFDWSFKMPYTKLRETEEGILFVGHRYSLRQMDRRRETRDRASINGVLELNKSQFLPNVRYSIIVKVFARIRTGDHFNRFTGGLRFHGFPKPAQKLAKICSIIIHFSDDSSETALLGKISRESKNPVEITDVREELKVPPSEISKILKVEFSFEGSEILFEHIVIQKLEV